MMSYISFTITLFILFISIIEGTEESRTRETKRNLRNVRASENHPMSSFGNASPEEGPWPECVGQQGSWCIDYISGWVGYKAHHIPQGRSMHVVSMIRPYEFHRDRVFIHVDHSGNVVSPPSRG